MGLLEETISNIRPLDETAARAAARRLDSLTKPRGSLGYLEQIVCKYAAVRHDPSATDGPAEIAVFVADHGIAEEGVSAYPQSVTAEMLRNIARGGAAISVLARHYGIRLRIVDIGVRADTRDEHLPNVEYQRVASGTRNFLRGAAMTSTEVRTAIELGIRIARESAKSGISIIGIGEMGIANSTAASAVLCAITGHSPHEIAGHGTGLSESGWENKVHVLVRALDLHRDTFGDAEALLAAVGGFEIAAMAGVCIGGASENICVMVDGFIATAAAAVADKMVPGLRAQLMFSHQSAEGGHQLALRHLEARPILDLDMRLGEGTAAAIAISTLKAALKLTHEMATFESASVSEKLDR